MRVYGRRRGVGRPRGGLGLAVVASMWALSAMSPISPISPISPVAAGASPGAPQHESQAPASLRSAIAQSLGARGPALPGLKQQAKLTPSDGASGDDFGLAVAVSGSTAVVGAPYHKSDTGAAYVFVRSGTTWTEQAELTASDGAVSDHFGYSVALSGSTAVIGAPFHNSAEGAAYVFVRSGTTWSQWAELSASDAASANDFGNSVAVSGTTAVIGAPFRNSDTGAAYVFADSGGLWTQQAELTASDGAQLDDFGTSVALSGSTAVVGAPFHNSATGVAYVFVRSGTTWSQHTELTARDAAQLNDFGYSVALSGSTAVVGAPLHDAANTGAAYVFVHSGGRWTQQAELTASDAAQGDDLGASVAVSVTGSGSSAVVGAPYHNTNAGEAYAFVRAGTKWSQQAKLTATDAASGDELGFSVAVSKTTAVVGAPTKALVGARNGTTNPGAAYVFRFPTGLS